MWTFKISTGTVSHDGVSIGKAYSGAPGFIDNPAMESLVNRGPLPEGWYTMGKPVDSEETGNYSIPLIPDMANVMYNRDGFFWHGDNIHKPGTASHGCMVSDLILRQTAIESNDTRLNVTA
jgi:hypothetical protein